MHKKFEEKSPQKLKVLHSIGDERNSNDYMIIL